MTTTTTTAPPRTSGSSAAYQILHLGFTVAPILFGLDKFRNLSKPKRIGATVKPRWRIW